jgi:hypothetical protein
MGLLTDNPTPGEAYSGNSETAATASADGATIALPGPAKFDGDLLLWPVFKMSIMAKLIAQRLLKFVMGKAVTAPDGTVTYPGTEEEQQRAWACIVAYLAPSLQQYANTLTPMLNGHVLWAALTARCEGASEERKLEVLENMLSLTLKSMSEINFEVLCTGIETCRTRLVNMKFTIDDLVMLCLRRAVPDALKNVISSAEIAGAKYERTKSEVRKELGRIKLQPTNTAAAALEDARKKEISDLKEEMRKLRATVNNQGGAAGRNNQRKGFNGNCWHCDAPGHSQFNCPDRQKLVDAGQLPPLQGKGKGKGGKKGGNTSAAALAIDIP